MSLTKSVAEVDAWAEIAQNAIREGAPVDVSGCYDAVLHVDCCLSSTAAHTGTEIIVEVSSNSSGDADWSRLATFIGPIGTAIKVDLGDNEAAGQTELTVANPVTNNMDNDGKFKFMEHTGTPANSEIIFQTANSGDAGDTITSLDGLTNAQTTDSDIWDIDSATLSAVMQIVCQVPMSANRVRVVYNNKYDSDGATVHTRCRISKVTGI